MRGQWRTTALHERHTVQVVVMLTWSGHEARRARCSQEVLLMSCTDRRIQLVFDELRILTYLHKVQLGNKRTARSTAVRAALLIETAFLRVVYCICKSLHRAVTCRVPIYVVVVYVLAGSIGERLVLFILVFVSDSQVLWRLYLFICRDWRST